MNSATRLCGVVAACIAATSLLGCGSAQSRKAHYIEHGQAYYAAGNYDKARVEFRNAAQIDPKDAQVRLLLGQVAEKTGDLREAVGQYQSAVNENPKLATARAALSRLYLYGGLADRVLELAEPGLTVDPNNAQLLTVRGAAEQQLGEHDAALQDAERAVQLSPTDDYAIALLASVYRQRAETDRAIATVQAGLQRLPNNVDLRAILADLYVSSQQRSLAEAQLKQIVALDPKSPTHRYQLAKFYLAQRNLDAAEQTLQQNVANVPTDTNAKVQLVEFLDAQRGRESALSQVDQFTAAAPNDDELKLALGQLLMQAGVADRAETLFRSVIEHAGTKPMGLAARDRVASLLLARDDRAGAEAQINQVLKENARDNDALVLRAQMELLGTNPAAAVTDLRSVLRDQPNSVPLMRALAKAYVANGEADQAEQILRGSIQISPKDSDSRLQLAQLMLNAKKLDQATPLLEQLAKDDPGNASVQQALVQALLSQNRAADARAAAISVQQAHPDLALGFYLAGVVDQAAGKDSEAEKDLQQALGKQPGAIDPLSAFMRLELRLKHPEVAMQRLDAAITTDSKNVLARNLKAELLLAQGQTDAAIATYRETIAAAPKWVPAYQGLAFAQVAAKKSDDAVITLRDGIAKTGSANALLADLSALYQQLGHPDDAIALYSDVLAKSGDATFAKNNLAMLLVTYRSDAPSLGRAQQLADQLADVSVVDVIDTRGWVNFKVGRFHEAETLLQQAVDKAPDAPELRYHLGMAQMRSGENQSAAQNLESALNSTQSFSERDEARAVLAQLKKTSAG